MSESDERKKEGKKRRATKGMEVFLLKAISVHAMMMVMMTAMMMVWMLAIGSSRDLLEQGRAAVTILVRH